MLVFVVEILDRKNIPNEFNLKFGSAIIYSIFSELVTNHTFPSPSLFLMDVPSPSLLFLLVYFFPLLSGVKRKLCTYFQMLHLHVQPDTAAQLGTEGGLLQLSPEKQLENSSLWLPRVIVFSKLWVIISPDSPLHIIISAVSFQV